MEPGMTKESKQLARAVALKEYYERMQAQGYKKYGMLLKIETIAKIDVIADELNIPKYQLIDKILTDYIESIKKQEG
jgi:hypothetical protein